jgi:hypothetical protein
MDDEADQDEPASVGKAKPTKLKLDAKTEAKIKAKTAAIDAKVGWCVGARLIQFDD